MVESVKIFKIKEKLHTDLNVCILKKKVRSWEIEKYNSSLMASEVAITKTNVIVGLEIIYNLLLLSILFKYFPSHQ